MKSAASPRWGSVGRDRSDFEVMREGAGRSSAASPYVVAGQRWRSLDPRDDGLVCTVLSTSGPGGYVEIQRFRKSRVLYSRFVKSYALVTA